MSSSDAFPHIEEGTAAVLDRVDALSQKAYELMRRGHVLRAAEYYGRAAEVARAFGEDNLVAVPMLICQGNMVGIYVENAPKETVDPGVFARYRAENVALFSSAAESLERRRVSGTLLEGKCTAVEEAWYMLEYCGQHVRREHKTDVENVAVSFNAALVGYDEFLRSAEFVLNLFEVAGQFATECSDEQFLFFTEHVVRAAELMGQPRRHGCSVPVTEVTFATALRDAAADEAGMESGLDASLWKLLASAWQQLQRSGVLQERNIEERMGSEPSEVNELMQQCIRALSAPGLRSCALSSCGAKEAHPQHFKACAACRRVVYCCKEHQSQDWPSHKAACKAARQAKAESQAGPSGA